MKVTMQKKDLLRGYMVVSKAVPKRKKDTTLPILRHVRLSAPEGAKHATFLGTDLDEMIEFQRPVTIDEPGVAVLPPGLWDFVRALPKGAEITLATHDDLLHVDSGIYHAWFQCEEVDDFPIIHCPTDEPITLALPGNTLRRMVNLVAFAATNDRERPVLTGVLTQYDGHTLMMGAADGFRLSLFRLPLKTELKPFKVIIPARVLCDFGAMIGTRKEYVFVDTFKKHIALRLPGYKLLCTPVKGTYPNLDDVIPNHHQTSITADVAPLLEACRVVMAINSTKSQLYLDIVDEKMSFETRRVGEVGAQAELPVKHTGDPLNFAINVDFLHQALKAVDTDQIIVEGIAPSRPITLKLADGTDFKHVVMLMLRSEDAP